LDEAAPPCLRPSGRWFGDSVVVDLDGRPLIVYRGEHGSLDVATGDTVGASAQTRLGSISFGSRHCADRYAMKPNVVSDHADAPRITPAFLSIQRPVMNRPDDPFIELRDLANALGDEATRRIAIELAPFVEHTNNWDENFADRFSSVEVMTRECSDYVDLLFLDAYAVFDCARYVDWLKAAGYDGAVHGGAGESMGEAEYKVFSENQILPIYQALNSAL